MHSLQYFGGVNIDLLFAPILAQTGYSRSAIVRPFLTLTLRLSFLCFKFQLYTTFVWVRRCFYGHYPDKSFRLRRFLFAMKYFPEDHTANNISAKIPDMVHEIELNPKTVRWVTIATDGAGNIQKRSKTNSDIDTGMWYLDHKVHLIVTGSLAEKDKEKKM